MVGYLCGYLCLFLNKNRVSFLLKNHKYPSTRDENLGICIGVSSRKGVLAGYLCWFLTFASQLSDHNCLRAVLAADRMQCPSKEVMCLRANHPRQNYSEIGLSSCRARRPSMLSAISASSQFLVSFFVLTFLFISLLLQPAALKDRGRDK